MQPNGANWGALLADVRRSRSLHAGDGEADVQFAVEPCSALLPSSAFAIRTAPSTFDDITNLPTNAAAWSDIAQRIAHGQN